MKLTLGVRSKEFGVKLSSCKLTNQTFNFCRIKMNNNIKTKSIEFYVQSFAYYIINTFLKDCLKSDFLMGFLVVKGANLLFTLKPLLF